MNISARYYNLGIELGLHPGKLEAVQQTYSLNVTEALTQVLLLWLRRQYDVETHGPPTWQRLREAVESPAGGDNPALAEEIAEKHLISSMSCHSFKSLSPPFLSLLGEERALSSLPNILPSKQAFSTEFSLKWE